MEWYKATLELYTKGKGMHNFTEQVQLLIRQWGIQEGMCHLYVQHTSASMVISESYDSTARMDMEAYMEKYIPENQPWYRHTIEGSDDSPSHIRAMLTSTSLSIPIDEGALSLGTWQGIYLFEHRARSHVRKVQVRCLKVE